MAYKKKETEGLMDAGASVGVVDGLIGRGFMRCSRACRRHEGVKVGLLDGTSICVVDALKECGFDIVGLQDGFKEE